MRLYEQEAKEKGDLNRNTVKKLKRDLVKTDARYKALQKKFSGDKLN
jgi:hypothetical protein